MLFFNVKTFFVNIIQNVLHKKTVFEVLSYSQFSKNATLFSASVYTKINLIDFDVTRVFIKIVKFQPFLTLLFGIEYILVISFHI